MELENLTPFNFNNLFGERVHITAIVDKFIYNSQIDLKQIILGDIYINGHYFRDHLYITMNKRFNDLKEGSRIKATAFLKYYYDVDTNKLDKIGFERIRNVRLA